MNSIFVPHIFLYSCISVWYFLCWKKKLRHLSVKLYTYVTLITHMTKYESYMELRVTWVYSFKDKWIIFFYQLNCKFSVLIILFMFLYVFFNTWRYPIYTQRNRFVILLNKTEIRWYLLFSNWFWTNTTLNQFLWKLLQSEFG